MNIRAPVGCGGVNPARRLLQATPDPRHGVRECLVWMAPAKQDIFEVICAFVRSSLVSGLFARFRPLALMGSANQAPFCFAGKTARDIRRGVLVVAADFCTITSQVLLSRIPQILSGCPWFIGFVLCQNRPDDTRRFVCHRDSR